MCYNLTPRIYSDSQSVNVILDESDEVLEIIFIVKGEVGVGFKLQNALEDSRYELTTMLGTQSFFADYHVFTNTRSEFCYIAPEHVEALSLSKRCLLQQIFPLFPAPIFRDFQ